MNAVIDQSLGHIQLGHAVLAERRNGDELVGVRTGERQVIVLLDPGGQVVRRQHGGLGHTAQPGRSQRPHVRVGSHQHADLSVEGPHLADAGGPIVIQGVRAVGVPHDLGRGQKRAQRLADRNRSGPGAPAAVRRAERFVRVEVHDVHAEVAGPGDAQNRVHVGPVEIKHRAMFM